MLRGQRLRAVRGGRSVAGAMSAPAPNLSPLVRRYSLDEFFALSDPPGGGHYELIAGVLYMVPPPEWPHNISGARLNRVLSRYQDAHADRCELFVPRTPIWTPRDTYLEPDLMLVTAERLAGLDRGRITSADLVVEIHSPGSSVYDRTTKADTYAALGVAEYWLADPEARRLEQRLLRDGRLEVAAVSSGTEPIVSPVFPGLRVSAADVFS